MGIAEGEFSVFVVEGGVGEGVEEFPEAVIIQSNTGGHPLKVLSQGEKISPGKKSL